MKNNCKHTCLIFCSIIHFIILLQKVSSSDIQKYGVLAAESSSDKENFCIIYFPEFAPLPSNKSEAEFHVIQDESSLDLCVNKPLILFKSKIILLSKSNCSLTEQANVVQEQGGAGALFISLKPDENENIGNSSETESVNIFVALISQNSVQRLREMKEPVSVKMFAPRGFSFDYSLLIIWFVAMFTICVGGFWSGIVRFRIYSEEVNKTSGLGGEMPDMEGTSVNPTSSSFPEESALNISPYAVFVFVLCMGGTLLLLYFFFDYLAYFLIGLFVIVSINSVYVCFYPLMMRIFPPCFALFDCPFIDRKKPIDVRHIFLFSLSIATAVTWVTTRKDKYSWILQDLLGVLFCINMLKTIRMPNLKICAFLLTLLFFYDIFFVFITPFWTAKGSSVMEEVATGGPSKEMLPMVLRVPHLNYNPLAVCYQQFSLLGFGDILVPGLLISYCHSFDLITGEKKKYFILVIVAYGFGLIFTFIGVNLMATAQPALLYLVPSTLIPPVLLAWFKGKLSLLWNGFPLPKSRTTVVSAVSSTVVVPSELTSAVRNGGTPEDVPSESIAKVATSQENFKEVHDSLNERRHLLN